MVGRDRLLEEEHPPPAREALHQVLRPLADEIPAKMREADQVATGGTASRSPGPFAFAGSFDDV